MSKNSVDYMIGVILKFLMCNFLLFNKFIRKFFSLYLVVFIISLNGVSLAKNIQKEKYGGQLVLTGSDPKSFNAILAKETSTTAVTGFIFEGLVEINGFTAQVEPGLADRWDVSADGLEWTFFLREDVKWTDGNKFTADDVLFTFNDLIYNEDIPSSARDIYTIDGKKFEVKKIDDYTIKFILPVKFAPFLRSMGQSILPKHLLQDSVKQGKFNFTWGIDTDPKDIIGTGPYKLMEYQPGERIVFERNELYWKKTDEGESCPFIQRIIFLITQNADVAMLKFIDGEVDYLSLRGIDYPLIKPLEEKGNFTVYDVGPAFGTNFITFNQNKGVNPKSDKTFVDPVKSKWFNNLKFRQAVAHSIDKNKIIEIVMNGLGYPQDSAMSPSAGFFYNGDVKKYKYDLQKAKEILEDAGFKDRNSDGIIEDADGNQVKFNLYTNAGTTEREQIAEIIRYDLQRLGMKINYLPLEFNNLVGKLTSTYEWDAIIIGLTGGVEPHFGKNVWSSEGVLHMWYPKQEEPTTEWEKRIDEIFSEGVQELDENKRKVLYDEHQLIVSKHLPLIYTVLGSNVFAIRNKFENIKPSSYGGAFHNLEEIYIKEEFK